MPSPTVRRSVNLPPEVDKALTEYARRHSYTITEAIIAMIRRCAEENGA